MIDRVSHTSDLITPSAQMMNNIIIKESRYVLITIKSTNNSGRVH